MAMRSNSYRLKMVHATSASTKISAFASYMIAYHPVAMKLWLAHVCQRWSQPACPYSLRRYHPAFMAQCRRRMNDTRTAVCARTKSASRPRSSMKLQHECLAYLGNDRIAGIAVASCMCSALWVHDSTLQLADRSDSVPAGRASSCASSDSPMRVTTCQSASRCV